MDTTTDKTQPPPAHGLTGSHRIRVLRPTLKEATRLCPKAADYFDLRAQVLKLRYWPATQFAFPNGHVLDLDWSWIKAIPNGNVGELRIDDPIGGHTNLRAIFLVGDPDVKLPLPIIWILAILAKKRQDFTSHEISIFRARRTLVIERFYKFREFR